jgi:catechol 2,3-dioxygenase-like lactoylglutathione lyase family enzyme
MRIGHIELFVRDPLISCKFYHDVLGFEVIAVQGRNVWVKLDQTEILLRPGEPPQSTANYGGAGLVLYTDDLQATAAALQARGLKFSGTDGSPKCLTFHDPNGHWFQLVNPKDH